VLELTEGYPFLLQEYGRHAWSQDDDPTITLGDVEAAQPVVEASLSPLRDDLMRSAIIYSPRRGYLDFTVPHCARFVRRHYPFGE